MTDLNKELCQILLGGTASGDEVRALIARGASANASDVGMSALHWAARHGLVDATRVLLEHGADRDSQSTNAGSAGTPVHAALWVGASDAAAALVVRALLDAGASPTTTTARGEAPLHLAAERGLVDVIDVLAPVTPLDTKTHDGQTALERALVQGKIRAAVRLFGHGAPVDDACVRRAPPRVRELLERGVRAGSDFTAFACVIAEHLPDGPALDAVLSLADARAFVDKLAVTLGQDVGMAIASNDDVDHFQEEYGDGWLDEMIDSYWDSAHAETVRTAWATLPAAMQREVALEEAIDEARARFEAAVRERA